MGLGNQRPDEAHHIGVRKILYVQEHQAQLQQRRESTARLLEEHAISQLLCMGRLQERQQHVYLGKLEQRRKLLAGKQAEPTDKLGPPVLCQPAGSQERTGSALLCSG